MSTTPYVFKETANIQGPKMPWLTRYVRNSQFNENYTALLDFIVDECESSEIVHSVYDEPLEEAAIDYYLDQQSSNGTWTITTNRIVDNLVSIVERELDMLSFYENNPTELYLY